MFFKDFKTLIKLYFCKYPRVGIMVFYTSIIGEPLVRAAMLHTVRTIHHF